MDGSNRITELPVHPARLHMRCRYGLFSTTKTMKVWVMTERLLYVLHEGAGLELEEIHEFVNILSWYRRFKVFIKIRSFLSRNIFV